MKSERINGYKHLWLIVIVCLSLIATLSACSDSNNKKDDNLLAFHGIAFKLPDGFKYDKSASKDANTDFYYSYIDNDKKEWNQMLMLQMQDKDIDLSNKSSLKELIAGFKDDSSISNFSYKTISIEDKVTPTIYIQFNQTIGDNNTECEGIIFSDSQKLDKQDKQGLYSIIVCTIANSDVKNDNKTIMNDLIETLFTYETFNSEDPSKDDANNSTSKKEIDLNDLVGEDLSYAIDQINKAGFTASYLSQGEDWTDFIDDMKDDYNVKSIDDIDNSNKTCTVNIELKESKQNKSSVNSKELEEKLSPEACYEAIEQYGKAEYGKFSISRLNGQYDPHDKASWIIKAPCEVGELDMTCEAVVKGTTNNPIIVSFDVY